ncbi:variable lymphocyte receptor a [Plakobranchus ocellatus]|uniref:Copper transport protein n=1 Tax=Plakobranchus ocellatus TaxID=259542 RepID=A0AAV4AQ38_9GAST|nr:variable lymphocyte receptor a [Plakobranchus ocellatus]
MHALTWNTDTFVLVKQWKSSSMLGLLSAALLSCAISVFYEWLVRFLNTWDRRPHLIPSSKRLRARSLRSVLHALSACTSYVIMLFLMTYNLWVLVAILFGAVAGYFFLGPKVYGMTNRDGMSRPEKKADTDVTSATPLTSKSKEEIIESESSPPRTETEVTMTTALSHMDDPLVYPDDKDVNSALISTDTDERPEKDFDIDNATTPEENSHNKRKNAFFV